MLGNSFPVFLRWGPYWFNEPFKGFFGVYSSYLLHLNVFPFPYLHRVVLDIGWNIRVWDSYLRYWKRWRVVVVIADRLMRSFLVVNSVGTSAVFVGNSPVLLCGCVSGYLWFNSVYLCCFLVILYVDVIRSSWKRWKTSYPVILDCLKTVQWHSIHSCSTTPNWKETTWDQALDQNPCLVDEGCDLDSVHEYAKEHDEFGYRQV